MHEGGGGGGADDRPISSQFSGNIPEDKLQVTFTRRVITEISLTTIRQHLIPFSEIGGGDISVAWGLFVYSSVK